VGRLAGCRAQTRPTPSGAERPRIAATTAPHDDGWVPVDLFGREVSTPVDWLEAEALLEERGIHWLADIWMLERDDAMPLRVRIVEVTPDRNGVPGRVVVQTDDFGAIDAPVSRFELPWPAPDRLRPRRDGDPDGRVFG
jgi:hypothetical protein